MKKFTIGLTIIFSFLCVVGLGCKSRADSATSRDNASAVGTSAVAANTATSQNQKEELPYIREPDIYFVPTPQEVVDKMLELAQVKKTDLVYDLGCGDGRIVVTAAQKFGCKAVGYDIDPTRVIESRANVKNNNLENLVTIEQKDVFTLDLSNANVITLYLLPSLNVKLIPQLEKLKPGARIVSHDFDMKGIIPDQIVTVKSSDGGSHTVYLWTTPLKKEAPTEELKFIRNPDIFYLPTPQAVVDKMVELANVKKTDLVYDLGCGDGRIVITAAKKIGCKAVGYDIDPNRVIESRANVKNNKVESLVTIEQKDVFTLDLSDANVITLYLLPELNVKLIPQLEKLKPGSRIVSHDFDMKGVIPDQVVTVTDSSTGMTHRVYLWTTPLKKEGQEQKEELKFIRDPDILWVPTPQEAVDKMLELAQVKKTDLVYDLGCGDGIIVITAAKKYGCTAVGYDIDPTRVIESRANVKKNNLENLVTIEQKDVFTLDLSNANVITLYLLPELNVKLIPQLEKLKPGSRIVSHDFDMKGVIPDQAVTVQDSSGRTHTVYLWTTPLKKE
jgi:cyclopropane fatty-acyl-phospholipid synthase-like methyltransferase